MKLPFTTKVQMIFKCQICKKVKKQRYLVHGLKTEGNSNSKNKYHERTV